MELNIKIEKAPGFVKYPDYSITMEVPGHEETALLQGRVIAQSHKALILLETNHLPVVYFPREDVRMDLAVQTDKDSFCPFKGHASYYGFGTEANIAWSYENPYQESLQIKGYIAFYADRLDQPLRS